MKAPDAVISYRPDVDGLRAVAVLAVIGFHLRMSMFRGGFVGVDIFFVISGYLISSIILKEIRSDRFSIARFYERRILRIFPALFFVLLFCSAAAWVVLFPNELMKYARSLIAATLSFSNFYFARDSGYFVATNSTLLLHTWSLAVEEQFYILFPLVMLLLQRIIPKRLVPATLTLFAASFALSAFGVRHDADSTFYMPYTRAWELLLGTILSLRFIPVLRSAVARNVISLLGLGLVCVSILRFSSRMPFPGPVALIPCGGAALLIYAGMGGSSAVTRLLSLKWTVGIGLISYSLYLWHWPLIVLHQLGYISIPGGPRPNNVFLLAMSLAAGFLSWKYIEQPFRTLRGRIPHVQLFTSTFAIAATALLFAGILLHFNGFGSRFPPRALQIASYLDNGKEYEASRLHTCFLDRESLKDFKAESCLHMDTTRPNWLLFGDSHAAVLWHALSQTLPEINLLQANVAGCKPSVDVTGRKDAAETCVEMTRYIFGNFLPSHRIDGLVVSANWHGNPPNPQDERDLQSLVAWTKQREVPLVVLGPSPEFDEDVPRLLALSIVRGDSGLPMRHLLASQADLDQNLATQAKTEWHVPYVSIYQAACSGRTNCLLSSGDAPVWFDSDHFSDAGARLILSHLRSSGDLLERFRH